MGSVTFVLSLILCDSDDNGLRVVLPQENACLSYTKPRTKASTRAHLQSQTWEVEKGGLHKTLCQQQTLTRLYCDSYTQVLTLALFDHLTLFQEVLLFSQLRH